MYPVKSTRFFQAGTLKIVGCHTYKSEKNQVSTQKKSQVAPYKKLGRVPYKSLLRVQIKRVSMLASTKRFYGLVCSR